MNGQSATQAAPVFFLNFNIPQVGTDTKVKLELVPFGLKPEGKDLICYEYQQLDENNVESLMFIQKIAEAIKHDESLDLILAGKFDKISSDDNELIRKLLSEDNLKTIETLKEKLSELKLIYDQYQKLECTEITLGWNRENSRFYIKEKGKKPEKITFRKFLIENSYWTYVC